MHALPRCLTARTLQLMRPLTARAPRPSSSYLYTSLHNIDGPSRILSALRNLPLNRPQHKARCIPERIAQSAPLYHVPRAGLGRLHGALYTRPQQLQFRQAIDDTRRTPASPTVRGGLFHTCWCSLRRLVRWCEAQLCPKTLQS
jgi:hypothetical protein